MLYVKTINDQTGNRDVGNYRYEVGVNRNIISAGEVKGHTRSDGWRSLVKKVVEAEDEKCFDNYERWSDMIKDMVDL